MKICMVVISDLRYDVRVYKEAKSLADAGYQITLIGFNSECLQKESKESDGLRIVQFPAFYKNESNCFQRTRRILSIFKLIASIYLLTLRTKAKVYHAHDIEAILPAFLSSKIHKGKFVYDSHELFSGFFAPKKFTKYWLRMCCTTLLEKAIIGKADYVITVNEPIAAELSKRFGIPKPVVLMNCPNRVPIKNTKRLKQIFGLDEDVKIVIYQGGFFLRDRPLDNLIRSAPYIKNAIIVLLGFDQHGSKEKLQQLTKELRLENRVKFLPPVPHQALLEYTASADVGVMPAVGDNLSGYYYLPNKIFEYLMAGIPIACGDLPEMGRVIKECDVGEVFDARNPRDIARAINKIINDEKRLERLKRNARKAALEKYSWEIEEKKLSAVYEEIMKTQ